MASNLVVARGGVEYIPPISLAFWRWLTVFLILLIFNYTIFSKKKIILKEYKKLFFLGFMGCGVCGAFPFIAGQTTTIINMGIIYKKFLINILPLRIINKGRPLSIKFTSINKKVFRFIYPFLLGYPNLEKFLF